ncbi:MAG: hypothetical protein ACK4E8_07585 [Lacibacter sp.]
MRKNLLARLCLMILLPVTVCAQQRAINHNTTRSNKTSGAADRGNWAVGVTPSGAFALRSGEAGLFRGNGWGTDLQANWQPGALGLGMNGGFVGSSFSQTAINSFLTQRGIPSNASVATGNPLQAYMLAGPLLQLGNRLRMVAGLQGGLFLNNAGSVVINREGASVPYYRFEGAASGLRPGWGGNLGLAYSFNSTTALQLGVRMLQSATPIRLFDPAQGIDVPRTENRNTPLLTTGLSLIKEFSTRGADAATAKNKGSNRGYVVGDGGVARGKQSGNGGTNPSQTADIGINEPGINKKEKPGDDATGSDAQAREVRFKAGAELAEKGKKQQKQGSNRGYVVGDGGVARGKQSGNGGTNPSQTADIGINEPGINKKEKPNNGATGSDAQAREGGATTEEKLLPTANALPINTPATNPNSNPACGPVLIKETLPDGRVQELTFSCPEDAALYRNVSPTRTSQGATFGERVNQRTQQSGNAVASGAGLLGGTLPSANEEGSFILTGQLRLRSGGSNSPIVTNRTQANHVGGASSAAYSATGMAAPAGGPVLALFAAEPASGTATGKRNFQLVYNEQTGTACTTCPLAAVSGNPISGLTVKGGRNPMADTLVAHRTGAPAGTCNGIGGITVHLRNATTGALLASTETDACGNFWFAAVPGKGKYAIELDGYATVSKTYNFTVTQPADVGGEWVAVKEEFEFVLERVERTPKSGIGGGNSGKGAENNAANRAGIHTSRSNARVLLVVGADTDGDGLADRFTVTARLQDGSAIALPVTQSRGSGGRTEAQADLPVPATRGAGIPTSRSNIKRIMASGGGQLTVVFTDGTSREVTGYAETASIPGAWQAELLLGDSDGDGQSDYVWHPRSNLVVTATNPAADRSSWQQPAIPQVITLPLHFSVSNDALFVAGNRGNTGSEARPGNPIGGLTVKGGRNPGGDLQNLNRITNTHGEFLWNNLAPGTYRLQTEYRIKLHHNTIVDDLNGLIR